jgi:hypothetical protein
MATGERGQIFCELTSNLPLLVMYGSILTGCVVTTGNHKKGDCGGHLNVDMNASTRKMVTAPIENIFCE